MTKSYIKSYRFSLFCIALIWVLCLMPVPEIKLSEEVPFIDKWTHIIMYLGTCSIIWIEHKEKADKNRLLIGAVIMPILMSGILELLQEYCTGGLRSGDWMDFAANIIGVILAAIFGSLLYRKFIVK